jgi:hypothetical protein
MSNRIQLDLSRENWLFLVLGVDHKDGTLDAPPTAPTDAPVAYWEFGVGNANSLFRSQAEQRGIADCATEAELLDSLFAELRPYRYDATVLITPTHTTVEHLRRRIVKAIGGDKVSLRGFNHVAVAEILDKYFGEPLDEYDTGRAVYTPPRSTETEPTKIVSEGATQALWTLWTDLFRVVPATAVTGDPL